MEIVPDDHIHLPLDLAHMIAYCMMVITLAFILYLSLRHGRDIMKGLKGDNNRWDAPEIIILIFLPLSVSAVLSDIFLGFHPSPATWLFISSGLGIGSGARAWVEKKVIKQKPLSDGED